MVKQILIGIAGLAVMVYLIAILALAIVSGPPKPCEAERKKGIPCKVGEVYERPENLPGVGY
jgi:hypothetical protein